MKRYRSKNRWGGDPPPPSGNHLPRQPKQRLLDFDRQLETLARQCNDHASGQRLGWLRERYESQRPGVSDSARAEVELATLFIRAGFSVSFLPESDVRTADLECYMGVERVFVEATTIMGTGSKTNKSIGKSDLGQDDMDGGQWGEGEKVLVKRIVSRMQEKARQLSDYCAPVILGLTVAEAQLVLQRGSPKLELDVKRLTGMLATTFPQVSPLSAVLLTLRDVQPRESHSNVRLSNVYLVERVGGEAKSPRVRLLALNPAATYPLDERGVRALKGVL